MTRNLWSKLAAMWSTFALLALASCAVPANDPAKFAFETTAERVAAKADTVAVADAAVEADVQVADVAGDAEVDAAPDVGGNDTVVTIDGVITDIDTGAMVSCLKSKCGSQYNACKADTDCAKALACVEVCKDIACMAKCPQPPANNAPAKNIQGCMAEMKCIPSNPPTPVCGNSICETGESTSSCPADCKTTGSCGNGKCDSGETPSSCPSDCKTTGTGVCGDGKCGSGESCPMDCNSKFSQSMQCAMAECQSQMAACSASAPCVEAFNCLISCNCQTGCMQECGSLPGATSNQVKDLGGCMSEMQCPDPCSTTKPTCPNGICDPGETSSTCPQDCKTTSPVCGNGKCESGETAASCPSDCGTTTGHICDANCGKPAPGNVCYCDSACKSQGDCCNAQGTAKAGNSCMGSTCAECK